MLRDPRCTLHSIVTDLNGQDGEIKLFGGALLADPSLVTGDYQTWRHGRRPTGYRVF